VTRSRARPPRAAASEAAPARKVSIRVLHRRLRVNRRGLLKALAALDQQFFHTASDLPELTPSARKRARAPGVESLKSGIVRPCPALPSGELSLAFLTDAALADLHGRFLNDFSTTDVITFEGHAEMGTAGEICVSVDTAARYSSDRQTDFSRELLLYVVHGWLHLAGYDDLRPDRKRRMRAAEKRALALINAADIPRMFRLA